MNTCDDPPATTIHKTQTMTSSPSGHHRHGRGRLLILAMVASLSAVVAAQNSQWGALDCQSSSTAAPPPTSSSFSSNSTFWSNVIALLAELPSAAAPTGFASLSRGNGTDRAFVRGLCRGDTTPAKCATYLQNAAQDIQNNCNSSRRAGIWYDDGSGVTYPAPMFCFVSFADTNTSTAYEDSFQQYSYNNAVASDAETFETTYNALMSLLALRVVNGSGSSSATAPMFATGAGLYDPTAANGTMYALLQCMRDRTAADCYRCLNDSVALLPSCCYGHRGGLVYRYNCYMRMEIYPFYDLSLDGPPLVPSFVGERKGDLRNRTACR
ncbi:hypothetical protein U9M48_040251 [Paspalum notatum var. saurae]|uniref:Gnk2-homologous domain-containing protein n=1 Tax=Paspalum notatum var. saurae TaxID=547442 RepID=A0AAQ3ULP7_PASNO